MRRVLVFFVMTVLIALYGALWGDHLSQRFPGCAWNYWTGGMAGLVYQVMVAIDGKICKWFTGFSRRVRLTIIWSVYGLYLWSVTSMDQQGNLPNPSAVALLLFIGGVLIIRLNVAMNKVYSPQ